MKKSFILWMLMSLGTLTSLAQQKEIRGTVTDMDGEPLIGVTITEKGKNYGTITDQNGKFHLSISSGSVLRISYIGYMTKEVTPNHRSNQIIRLQEETKALNEVVVVGFAHQKKVNLTGSVGTIDSKAFEAIPVQNAVQALQGKIPGLLITQNSGQLNSKAGIQVRGLGTIGEGSYANTLVLIDGMEGDLYSVNPQDIEDISVLKDAAASSIYGSRAPFGVILVTTKKGKGSKQTINYNNNFRINTAINMPESMDSYTWATFFNDAAYNSGRGYWIAPETMTRIRDYMDGKIFYNTVPMTSNPNLWNTGYEQANDNIDYYDVFYKDITHEQEHNISVGGGNEKISYYISGNFLSQGGKMNYGGDGLKRYNLAGKIEGQLSKYVSVNYNTRFTRTDYHQPMAMNDAMFFTEIGRQSWPISPLYDPNGYLFNDHVLRMRDGGQSKQQTSSLAQQISITLKPLKGWRIIGDFNYRYDSYFGHEDAYPVHQMAVDGIHKGAEWYRNWAHENANKTDYININAYSDYEKVFAKKHYIKVLTGFQAENNNFRDLYATKEGIMSPTIISLGTATGLGQDGSPVSPIVGGGYSSWSTAGFFGRLNYNYSEKYLFEANLRYDGSSRFRKNNRWGFFPSFSIGWNIAKENFFQTLSPIINTLKIRASYGTLGNQYTSSVYPTYASMGYQFNEGTWLINGKKTNTSWAPGLISASLSWEKIKSANIGLDFALFNNRLIGSFDYYKRKTMDMVGPSDELPVILGVDAPIKNNTNLETKGFELELSWRDQLANGFKYGARFVLSDSQSKITRYSNPSGTLSKYYSGMSWGEIWGYKTIGIAKTQEEMDTHLSTLPNGGQSYLGMDWAAGDIMYVDINEDGKIDGGSGTISDHGDLKVIGNTTPRFNFGLDINAEWKGIDFRVFLQGTAKRDYFQNSFYFWGAYNDGWWSMGLTEHKNYFRESPEHYLGQNLNSYYPRPLWGTTKNQQVQTRYLQNAAYMRIKNMQLGYTIPEFITQKIGISKLRFFVSGENLATFTNMISIFDPETIGTSMGNSYPLSKTYSFGLSVTF